LQSNIWGCFIFRSFHNFCSIVEKTIVVSHIYLISQHLCKSVTETSLIEKECRHLCFNTKKKNSNITSIHGKFVCWSPHSYGCFTLQQSGLEHLKQTPLKGTSMWKEEVGRGMKLEVRILEELKGHRPSTQTKTRMGMGTFIIFKRLYISTYF
jgi:hypothetical protein